MQANKQICRKDGCNRRRGTEISERIDGLAVIRDCISECPYNPRDEEHNGRLVETVEHEEPELRASVFEAEDTAFVQLWEGEAGSGVDVLVESWKKSQWDVIEMQTAGD